VWLRDRGITDAEIGTLFMSRQLVSVVSVLGIGFLAHRVGRLRGMLLALAVAAIVMMGVYQLSYTFVGLLLIGLLWGCVWSLTMALYDGVLVNEARDSAASSTALRVWGSVAFIAGTLCARWQSTISVRPRCSMSVGWASSACCRSRSSCRVAVPMRAAPASTRRSASSISSAPSRSCCS
jgi:PPP family 3-phenylpropionic acid transporter